MTPTSADEILPVLCLAGPTASGKTALALSLAERLPCEIINTDSRQVFRDFPLICAQPTPSEQAKCPHHLFGFLETSQKINAGQWLNLALKEIRAVLGRGHVPLLVGGTGMYFQVLLHGLAPIPAISKKVKAEVEERLDREGPLALHQELRRLDPEAAAKIHPHDRQRLGRALEVYLETGETLSCWQAKGQSLAQRVQGPLLVLAPERAWLKERIARRITWMMNEGALEEARRAYALCSDPAAPAWSGIGCAELLAHLLGRISLTECLGLWQKNTQAYAKRQMTWFRGRPEAIFFSLEQGEDLLKAAQKSWAKLTNI